VHDKRLLRLIRSWLKAGVLENELVGPTDEGTPQGGPLSPLLSNLVFSINLTVSWSEEGIGSFGMRTIATSMSAVGEQANA
jgi:hypothetical protein